MNICLVSYEYPPETFDGIGTYTQTLARALIKKGQQVHVITFTEKDPYHYADQGVYVHRINPANLRGLWRLEKIFPSKILTYSMAVAKKIKELHNQNAFDIIEGPDARAELLYYLLTRTKRKSPPVIVKLHTPSYILQKYNFRKLKIYERFLNFMEKQCILKADYLTSPSQNLAKIIAGDYKIDIERIKVIANAVNTQKFKTDKNYKGNSRLKILYAGRIEKIKGVKTLTYAIPEVLREFKNCKFTLIGQDTKSGKDRTSLKRELRRYLKKKKCENKVTFLDRKDSKELIKYYQTSDIAVVPSLYENLGYVCLEAMACGKPVVASNVGGLAEIIENRYNGLLVPPNDHKQLAENIIKLCTNKYLRDDLGIKALRSVERNYSTTTVVEKTINFYEKIVDRYKRKKK